MSLGTITKTAGDIATYVKRQFGDESGVQITDADIFRWINSGQLEACTSNKILKGKAITDLVAGQADYTLPTPAILYIESLHVNGSRLPHKSLPQTERDVTEVSSPIETAAIPSFWYEWGNTVTLWPTPNTTYTDGLTIYYSKLPTDVSASGDLLSLPDQYFEALISWVLSKAYELDEDYQAAQNQRAYFDRFLDRDGEEVKTAQQMTYPVITFVED